MKRVSYPKEMREHAKRENLRLVTIDVPGMCYQAPMSIDHAIEVKNLLLRIFKERTAVPKRRK